MDSEKILFCYRDDKVKKAVWNADGVLSIKPDRGLCDGEISGLTAFFSCTRKIFGKNLGRNRDKLLKEIKEIYEKSGATHLWLSKELCVFFGIEEMDLPECIYENWTDKIPFFHTLIFADDKAMHSASFLPKKTERVAALCVVCYEDHKEDYENMAMKIFWSEGLVLQVFTYDELSGGKNEFLKEVTTKGRVAVLDFEERRNFWDKCLQNNITYYSFGEKYGYIKNVTAK